jgi:hypothetical protein
MQRSLFPANPLGFAAMGVRRSNFVNRFSATSDQFWRETPLPRRPKQVYLFSMGRKQKRPTRTSDVEQAVRDQEVLRANRELAAYFRGRRTESEARAALKTIKAFVRDRAHMAPADRPPLPGALATRPADASRPRTRGKRRPGLVPGGVDHPQSDAGGASADDEA